MYKKDSRFNWRRYYFCISREMAVNYFFYHSFLHQPLQAMPSDYDRLKEQIHSLLLSPSSIDHDNQYHLKFDKEQNIVHRMRKIRLGILTKIRNYYSQLSKQTTKEQKQSILNDIIIIPNDDTKKDKENANFYMHIFFSTKPLKEWKDLLPPLDTKNTNDRGKLKGEEEEDYDDTFLNNLTKEYSSKSVKKRTKQQIITKEDYIKMKQEKREEERKADKETYQKEYRQYEEEKRQKKRIKMQGQIHSTDAMDFLAPNMVSAFRLF